MTIRLIMMKKYLFKYSRYYSGKEPEFSEGDVFRIVVPLDAEEQDGEFTTQTCPNTTQNTTQFAQSTTQTCPNTTQSATQTTQKTTQLEKQKQIEALIILLKQEPELSQRKLAERLELNPNTVKYYFRKLQEQGRLKHDGSSRKGRWIVEE